MAVWEKHVAPCNISSSENFFSTGHNVTSASSSAVFFSFKKRVLEQKQLQQKRYKELFLLQIYERNQTVPFLAGAACLQESREK